MVGEYLCYYEIYIYYSKMTTLPRFINYTTKFFYQVAILSVILYVRRISEINFWLRRPNKILAIYRKFLKARNPSRNFTDGTTTNRTHQQTDVHEDSKGNCTSNNKRKIGIVHLPGS